MRRPASWVLAVLLTPALAGCDFAGLQDMPLPGGPDLGDAYTVTVEFGDVLGLARQAAVKVDGVTVGQVVELERDGWHAEVVVALGEDVRLPADAVARVQQTSLLGEKFIALSAPRGTAAGSSTDTLEDGDRIPLARTSRGTEVEEVLGAASLMLNGGGLEQMKTISTELHAAMSSPEVDTRRFIEQLGTFMATLDDQRQTIITVLENVNRLAKQVNGDKQVVEHALDRLTPALQVLEEQRKPLVRMLTALSRFGQVSATVIRESGADLVADLRALQPILRSLQKANAELPESVEAILSFPFPDEVLRAARGDYVNLAVEMDLSALTLVPNVTGRNR